MHAHAHAHGNGDGHGNGHAPQQDTFPPPCTRHGLIFHLYTWTGLEQWDGLADTDVDELWDTSRLRATMKGHTSYAFIWITKDGDVYGLFVPLLMRAKDLLFEDPLRVMGK